MPLILSVKRCALAYWERLTLASGSFLIYANFENSIDNVLNNVVEYGKGGYGYAQI